MTVQPIIQPQIIDLDLPDMQTLDKFCVLCRRLASKFIDAHIQTGHGMLRITIDVKNLHNSKWSEEEDRFFMLLEQSGLITGWLKDEEP